MRFLSNNFSVAGTCFLIAVVLPLASCKEKTEKPDTAETLETETYREAYRPQFHFSPQEHWMNDPNGLVYHKGVYHLFYQYHPEDVVWGPMHWGHAVSPDLMHWEHRPIALFPDEHGAIFSGSAVVDSNNTSGFGTPDNPPLVAIFTYHDAKAAEAGRTDFQTQGIAYSLDNGATWTKYEGNPVLANEESIRDFRDPKVFWHEYSKHWIMILVAGDHAQFYRSTDLKHWELTGEFGKDQGAHGGVWECPDLFELPVENGEGTRWVLLISINPGAPNGGSGTQYFVGDFDGSTFSSDQQEHKWIDWGTDNYAGVTYNNTPDGERLFIGWMSNWLYAERTPTDVWRSAMTTPRQLTLRNVDGSPTLFSTPWKHMESLVSKDTEETIELGPGATERIDHDGLNQSELRLNTEFQDLSISLSNRLGDTLWLTMDKANAIFSLDRSQSGRTDFQEDFGNNVQKMPIPNLPETPFDLRMLIDRSSVEIFLNEGQYVMTAQIFPREPYTELNLTNRGAQPIELQNVAVHQVARTW